MEPLAQLKDIHLPEQINNYPLSLGWWLLAVIFICTVLFIIIRIRRAKQLKQCQQQAIKQLKDQTPDDYITGSVLKWAAMQYFPRDDIASLYGPKFKDFLINSLPERHQESFLTMSAATFDTLYQKNSTTNDLQQPSHDFQQAALLWLKHALPPKNKTLKPHQEVSKSGVVA